MHEHVSGHYNVPILGWFAKKTEAKVLKNADRIFGITEKVSNSVRSVYNLNSEPDYPSRTFPPPYCKIRSEMPSCELMIIGVR